MRKLFLNTLGLLAGLAVGGWILGARMDQPLLETLAKLIVVAAAVLLLLWLGWRLARNLLWRVGRRLAFSYFLIGVLPIPMVTVLVLLNFYLLSGFFLGHLYRDAVNSVQGQLQIAAEEHLARITSNEREPATREPLAGQPQIAVAVYRKAQKVHGDQRLPYLWPRGLADLDTATSGDRERTASYFLLPDGTPTLLAVAARPPWLVVSFLSEPVESELTSRSDVWVDLLRSDDPRKEKGVRFSFGGRDFSLHPLTAREHVKRRAGYVESLEAKTGWLDRPYLWWSEISGALISVQDGSQVADYVTATLNGNLRTVSRHLFSSSGDLDTTVLVSLLGVTGLLATIYLFAVAMAVFMIYTMSRAVNRLSRATSAVQEGDFSARIPVRRDDQVGALQRSFNQMAGNLERLVSTAAQKESVEKELEVARSLQRSLLPTDLPSSETVEFATLFEPSAAIGGDYFDILRIDESRIVVVVADVSGHGLPTGLRMAMLKAALVILVEESKEPIEILRRLSAMVRSQREERFFVTATVGVVDFRKGSLELTNAGHPPTYLIRRGEVREILLPGNPLGALGENYGQDHLDLEPEDVLVWLSDGLIEITDSDGEPFGYTRILEALDGFSGSATEARDRLLKAVENHAQGRPADDDQTLVVMRYRVPSSSSPIPKNE